MNRAAASAFGLIALSLSHGSALAGTCLTSDIMSPAGQRVSSPYGVDRTGRRGASNGYHQGLDVVNSQGAGTPIYSGSSGPTKFYHFGGGGNIADVTSGDTRFLYLHMNTLTLKKRGGRVQNGLCWGSGWDNGLCRHEAMRTTPSSRYSSEGQRSINNWDKWSGLERVLR